MEDEEAAFFGVFSFQVREVSLLPEPLERLLPRESLSW